MLKYYVNRCPSRFNRSKNLSFNGFTLAELLISVLILGVIATFTIPKVLISSQNGRYNSAAKEAAGTLSGAYDFLKQKGGYKGTPSTNLIQYINYAKYDTTSVIDDAANTSGSTLNCSITTPCLKLHNGGLLYFWQQNFQSSNCSNNQATSYTFDPDGILNSNIPSIEFEIFDNGRVSSWGQMTASDYYSSGTCVGGTFFVGNYDPSWFKW